VCCSVREAEWVDNDDDNKSVKTEKYVDPLSVLENEYIQDYYFNIK